MDTMRAKALGDEAVRDDNAVMRFRVGSGVGIHPSLQKRGDVGLWDCYRCSASMTPLEAGIMLDAVLMLSEPDCDSVRDGMHEDACTALRGFGAS